MSATTGEPLHIVAVGASTAVGRDAWSSAAAVRAGIGGVRQHAYLIDRQDQPVRLAAAPWLDVDLPMPQRVQALLVPALAQALEGLDPLVHGAWRVALALGLPQSRPGWPPDLQSGLLRNVLARHRGAFGASALFEAGHAASLLALRTACTQLAQGSIDACVVAGVDSYHDPAAIAWLEACHQLHGAGEPANAWGFVPGEAAGALLLVRESVVQRLGLAPIARVLGTGYGFEPHRIKTQTVCIAEGLTTAFHETLAALPAGERVSDLYGDMNGEPYRADEYGFACLRTQEHFASSSAFVAPADRWGDVAAAGGVLHAVLAVVAGIKGYARGPLAFLWASAEGGERATALLAVGAAR